MPDQTRLTNLRTILATATLDPGTPEEGTSGGLALHAIAQLADWLHEVVTAFDVPAEYEAEIVRIRSALTDEDRTRLQGILVTAAEHCEETVIILMEHIAVSRRGGRSPVVAIDTQGAMGRLM